MRAQRLISILMLLQARGRLTAQSLADELGVSVRTIYRDVDALSEAGIPIYGEPGPEGGYALVDGYRTHLTGLSDEEAQALAMVGVPAPLDVLGMAAPLKSALLKLQAAISPLHPISPDEHQRFYLDAVWWHQERAAEPALRVLQRAVWRDCRVVIRFALPPLALEIERKVAPYALVAKAGIWYLVYAYRGTVEVMAAAELLGVRMLDESFDRPPDFNLPAFWQAWCAEREGERRRYPVTVRVAPALRSALERAFGEASDVQVLHDTGDGLLVQLTFASLEAARRQLLPLGGAVEVLAPLPLRLSIADYAQQILAVYP